MTRHEIARLLIEARKITSHDDFVIVGSMSALGKTPNPPSAMVRATNVDLFARSDPNSGLEPLSDRLGMSSGFHRRYRYYADPASPDLLVLPQDWQSRLQMVDVAPDLRAWFIDVDDAAIAKYARGCAHDHAWIRTGLEAGLLSLPTIERRLGSTIMEPEERARAMAAIVKDGVWMREATLIIGATLHRTTGDDEARRGHKLLDDIANAAEQFKYHAARGRLKTGSFYLSEYDRAIQRAAGAALDGNGTLISASSRDPHLRAAIEKVRHQRNVIASSPSTHLDFNDAKGETLEAEDVTQASEGKTRRKILDKQLGALALFNDLYEGVTRTGQQVPIGALHRHAEERLRQSYAALVLVEQARDAGGIFPQGVTFVATGAKVQDKTTSVEYPAAHRLPCDLSTRDAHGRLKRMSDHFELSIDRLWIDKHVFAPTDRVHRLANVVDRWCEEAGMTHALARAATAVLRREMSAEEAMISIVEPGYQSAVEVSLDKIERNFSELERQELRGRIVDSNGEPYDALPAPLALHVRGLAERAVAKDLMERTLRAYSTVATLTPETRMQTLISVSTIVDNERRARATMVRSTTVPPQLPFAMARAKAGGAFDEAKAWLAGEHVRIGTLAKAAREALDRASDASLPLEARHSALSVAEAGAQNVEAAWSALINRDGPNQARLLDQKTRGCAPFDKEHREEFADRLRHVPKAILELAADITRERRLLPLQRHDAPDTTQQRAPASAEHPGLNS